MVTADIEPVTVESRTPWFEEHTPTFRPLWVIEAEDQIAAWLSFSSFYGRPAYSKTVEPASMFTGRFDEGFRDVPLTRCHRGACAGLNTLMGFIFAHNSRACAYSGNTASLDGVSFRESLYWMALARRRIVGRRVND
jgi:phosphinothricin acetyltransferase